MKFVQLKSNLGEGFYYVNTDNVAYIKPSKFNGTEIHFDKGNAIAVSGDTESIAKKLGFYEEKTVKKVTKTETKAEEKTVEKADEPKVAYHPIESKKPVVELKETDDGKDKQ